MLMNESQKAFALADRCAENPDIPLAYRNVFRAIRYQIWKSCGNGEPAQTALAKAAESTTDAILNHEVALCQTCGNIHTPPACGGY